MGHSKKPDILIGVMGVTGSGKSKFIQTMSNDEKIVVSKKRESCTKTVQSCNSFEIDGRTVELVDTPGFSDSKMTDTQVLELIGNWLKEKFDKDQKLHGILYIHRITDIRMDGAAVRSLAVFHNICGPEFLSNTAMVTSMWDRLRDTEAIEDAEEIEKELKEEEWKSLLDGGAMYARSNNTQQCCEEIVRKIVAKTPKTPKLQAELGAGVDLGDTLAGAGLRTEIDKQAKIHKEELEMIVQKHTQALEAGERTMANVLAKARAEREAQVIQDRKDQDKLRTAFERQLTVMKEETRKTEDKRAEKDAETQRRMDMQAENQRAEGQRIAEAQTESQRRMDMQAEYQRAESQRMAEQHQMVMNMQAENQKAEHQRVMSMQVENQKAEYQRRIDMQTENLRVEKQRIAEVKVESQRRMDMQVENQRAESQRLKESHAQRVAEMQAGIVRAEAEVQVEKRRAEAKMAEEADDRRRMGLLGRLAVGIFVPRSSRHRR